MNLAFLYEQMERPNDALRYCNQALSAWDNTSADIRAAAGDADGAGITALRELKGRL
jgi:hypothetical protein